MATLTFPFIVFWIDITTSLSVQLFTMSAVVLFIGLFLLSWLHAHSLAFLNPIPISDIEQQHPYLPSFQAIVVIFLCSMSLLVVALQTVSGRPPFDAPFQWLYLAAFFILSGSAGMLAELHWRGTREIAFAGITGTALSFLCLVAKFDIPLHRPLETLLVITLLAAAAAFAWLDLFRGWTQQVQVTAAAAFLLWLVIYY